MIFLDNNAIIERLNSGDPEQLKEVVEEYVLRRECMEPDAPPELSGEPLLPLARIADWDLADTLSQLVLTHAPPTQAPTELAKLIATGFKFDVMYPIAMNLKVWDNATQLTEDVVRGVGEHLRGADEDRVTPVGHFLECLLDGREEIRSATLTALKAWPKAGVPAQTNAEALR